MDIEEKIILAKKLIAQREEIDHHLADLFGGELVERKRGVCSNCGLAGHNARSCPSASKATGKQTDTVAVTPTAAKNLTDNSTTSPQTTAPD